VGQPEALEFALIAVAQLISGIEAEQDAVVGLLRILGLRTHEAARHAEVHHERRAVIGAGQQPLPAALGRGEPLALQRVRQAARADAVQHSGIAHLDAAHGLAGGAGLEHAAEAFYVGQLGHGSHDMSSLSL